MVSKLIQGRTLVCHPQNYEKLKNAVQSSDPLYRPDYIHRPFDITIINNPYVPSDEETGRWERDNVLPDDDFTQWVDDVQDPPSWAVYFGLVKKERRDIYFVMHQPSKYVPDHCRGLVKDTTEKGYL